MPDPTFLAAKRRRHRKHQSSAPAGGPIASVQVLSVIPIDNTGAFWIFNSPVSVEDNVPCPQLRIQTESGWHGASNIGGVSAYVIACDYDSGDLNTGGGDPWEVVDPPENIDFGGATLALPESGETVR